MKKKSIEAVNKALQEAEKELAAVKKEKEIAADNPERLIYLRRKETRVNETIESLKRAKAAAEYEQPEPTEKAVLLSGIYAYKTAHAEKVTRAAAEISAARVELRTIENELDAAAAECNADKIVELSEKKEGIENKLKYLTDAKRRVESLPVFPDGAFSDEWDKVCNEMLPEWKRRVTAVETAAAAYKEACSGFLSMHDTIKAARAEIEKTAENEGTPVNIPSVFTIGINPADLTIENTYFSRVSAITARFIGKPL